MQTVSPGERLIYFSRNSTADLVWQGQARLTAGYYDVESLATEIQRATNQVTNFPEPYEVTYKSTIGRYEFRNTILAVKSTEIIPGKITAVANIQK